MELHWKTRVMPRHSEFENTTQLVGFLPTDPGTTLFIIFTEGDLYGLRGAFIPDVDESYGYESEYDARHAAQDYMNTWIEKNVQPPPMWIATWGRDGSVGIDLAREAKPITPKPRLLTAHSSFARRDIETLGPLRIPRVHHNACTNVSLDRLKADHTLDDQWCDFPDASPLPHTDEQIISRIDRLMETLSSTGALQTRQLREIRWRLRTLDDGHWLPKLPGENLITNHADWLFPDNWRPPVRYAWPSEIDEETVRRIDGILHRLPVSDSKVSTLIRKVRCRLRTLKAAVMLELNTLADS